MKTVRYKFKIKVPTYKNKKPYRYAEFRRASNPRLFIRVFVWKSLHEMREINYQTFPKGSIKNKKKKIMAWCWVEPGNRTTFLGDIHFAKGHINLNYASHEAEHILLEHARNMNYKIYGQSQEYLCQYYGNMLGGLAQWLYKKKLLKI